ncbi:MAG: LysM domain-containing protein [Chloroflexota bacterium]
MKADWLKVAIGLLTALGSASIILGGVMLALSEGALSSPQSFSSPSIPRGTLSIPTISTGESNPTPIPVNTVPTDFSLPTGCPPPDGWQPVTIQRGDTLISIAERYNSTPELIARGNCLIVSTLLAGSIIYVPPPPPTSTSTSSPITCGPPPGWILYTVQPNDNLFRLGLAYGVTVPQLQFANCLGNSTLIRAGERIWVPNVPTRTLQPSLTYTPTRTPTPGTATSTRTSTPTSTATTTGTATRTNTPSPSATSTPTPTSGGYP